MVMRSAPRESTKAARPHTLPVERRGCWRLSSCMSFPAGRDSGLTCARRNGRPMPSGPGVWQVSLSVPLTTHLTLRLILGGGSSQCRGLKALRRQHVQDGYSGIRQLHRFDGLSGVLVRQTIDLARWRRSEVQPVCNLQIAVCAGTTSALRSSPSPAKTSIARVEMKTSASD